MFQTFSVNLTYKQATLVTSITIYGIESTKSCSYLILIIILLVLLTYTHKSSALVQFPATSAASCIIDNVAQFHTSKLVLWVPSCYHGTGDRSKSIGADFIINKNFYPLHDVWLKLLILLQRTLLLHLLLLLLLPLSLLLLLLATAWFQDKLFVFNWFLFLYHRISKITRVYIR